MANLPEELDFSSLKSWHVLHLINCCIVGHWDICMFAHGSINHFPGKIYNEMEVFAQYCILLFIIYLFSMLQRHEWPLCFCFSVTIDSIHEVCEGKKSEVFRRYADNRFDPNCCFSIYYGDRVKSLDLVSTNAEETRTWITGLKYLMAGISDEDSLARRQRTRDQYPLSAHTTVQHGL